MEPAIDRDSLFEVIGEMPEIFDDMVAAFEEEVPSRMTAIRTAIQSGDAAALAKAAHRLAGSAASFYAPACKNAASALEEIGHRGDLSSAEPALARLERELERLWAELPLVREELEL
jgi:HPt (histidine-containing phosphotransfer) domain-containing protein